MSSAQQTQRNLQRSLKHHRPCTVGTLTVTSIGFTPLRLVLFHSFPSFLGQFIDAPSTAQDTILDVSMTCLISVKCEGETAR